MPHCFRRCSQKQEKYTNAFFLPAFQKPLPSTNASQTEPNQNYDAKEVWKSRLQNPALTERSKTSVMYTGSVWSHRTQMSVTVLVFFILSEQGVLHFDFAPALQIMWLGLPCRAWSENNVAESKEENARAATLPNCSITV